VKSTQGPSFGERFPHPMTYLRLCDEIIERVQSRPTRRPDTDRIDRLMMHEQKEIQLKSRGRKALI
jgi:hypothetical protein